MMRPENVYNLSAVVKSLSGFKNIGELDKKGIYAIWWTDTNEKLDNLNIEVIFQGKVITKKEREKKSFSPEEKYHTHPHKWMRNKEYSKVCLYIGKASNIRKRIEQQLETGILSKNWYTKDYSITRSGKKQLKTPEIRKNYLVKRTSGCQVRAGIEHLFKNKPPSSIAEKLKHFGISYILEDCFAERFYMEDLAIGYYRPWFNLDSER